jgi:hypothetical protein
MEERTLQNTLNRWLDRIPPEVRTGAVATFIVGFLCNLFIFTNKAVNHDDIMAEFIYNNSLDISSGRYMWLLIRRITSYYDMPAFLGIISLVMLAMSAGMVVWLLGIRDKIFAVLLAGLLGTYPINACYYSYLSISPIYYFAILTAVLGIFIVGRLGERRWQRILAVVLGAVFIQMSLGTYQSFLALSVGLVFAMAFMDLLDREWSFGKWISRYAEYGVTALLGYGLYYVVNKLVLVATGESLRAYAGTDKMFVLDFREMLKSVRDSYLFQKQYYFSNDYFTRRFYVLLNCLILGVILAFVIRKLVELVRDKKWLWLAVLLVMTVTAPFFFDIILFMVNGKAPAHILMKYAQVVPYVFALTLVDSKWLPYVRFRGFKLVTDEKPKKTLPICCILQWVACVGVAGIIYIGALTTNQLYQRMYYNTKAIDTLCTDIVATLSSYEDFNIGEPVFFANFDSFFNDNYQTTTDTFSEDLNPYVWMGTDIYQGWYSTNHLMRYMDFNLHLHIMASNNSEKEKEVMATEEFEEMPVYPNGGSVKRINGLLTVKMGK